MSSVRIVPSIVMLVLLWNVPVAAQEVGGTQVLTDQPVASEPNTESPPASTCAWSAAEEHYMYLQSRLSAVAYLPNLYFIPRNALLARAMVASGPIPRDMPRLDVPPIWDTDGSVREPGDVQPCWPSSAEKADGPETDPPSRPDSCDWQPQ